MRDADYTKPAAQKVLQRTLDALATGPANTLELIAASGKSSGRARDYLMHLRVIGQISCVAEPEVSFRGSTPAIWEINPNYRAGPVDLAPVDDTVDNFPRKVIVRKQWTPNHVRGALECLLFGVPAAMRGVAA